MNLNALDSILDQEDIVHNENDYYYDGDDDDDNIPIRKDLYHHSIEPMMNIDQEVERYTILVITKAMTDIHYRNNSRVEEDIDE